MADLAFPSDPFSKDAVPTAMAFPLRPTFTEDNPADFVSASAMIGGNRPGRGTVQALSPGEGNSPGTLWCSSVGGSQGEAGRAGPAADWRPR